MATAAVSQITDILKDTLNVSNPKVKHNGEKAVRSSQPDIEYHPDEGKWTARTARRLAEDPSLLSTPLPNDFPKSLQSPLVWQGSDWKSEKEWVYQLNAEQLKEIDDALKHFLSKLHIPSQCRKSLIASQL
jgi:hypothetical protein